MLFAVAVFGSGLAGCGGAGTTGGDATTQNSSMKSSSGGNEEHKTAPQAWADLESRANTGKWVGAFVHAPGLSLLEESKQQAERESNRAMQGDLPLDAINAMVDQVAQQMAQTLPNVPEVKDAKNQLILAFSNNLNDPGYSGNPRLNSALNAPAHPVGQK